jgi:predicted nuclease of restriction endonuclease-like (RecB) superfamily
VPASTLRDLSASSIAKRQLSAWTILTATYWEIGRRIVEYEQKGKARARYGEALIERLANDLILRYGRGFSRRNLELMRGFYVAWQFDSMPSGHWEARAIVLARTGNRDLRAKAQTPVCGIRIHDGRWRSVINDSGPETADAAYQIVPAPTNLFRAVSVPNSISALLVSLRSPRAFYEIEAIRGGWSVRQLDRQVSTLFYERTALSKRKMAMLEKGQIPKPEDLVTLQDEIRDPFLLEFLDLKDEYSESELEEALIRHLEWFLRELGSGFTFVARQKRIRVGDTWYRIDLLLYHRGLRCLIIVDLKRGAFSHADAGQMNLYLNYAQEHLTLDGENVPVGIILCSDNDDAVVRYATGGISTHVIASRYRPSLPDEDTLRREIVATQRVIESRASMKRTQKR